MIKHECEKCGYGVKNDACYCETCKDEELQKAFTEGYEEAKKEFNK